MQKNIAILAVTLTIALLFTAISGCSGISSFLPSPSPASGPVHSDESSPISSTQNVNIVRSGNTITASGTFPYNINIRKDPFLLKQGEATVTINLQGNGFGCSIGLNYKSPSTQNFNLIQLYVMDDNRSSQVTKTIMIPYTGDYYLSVNWADSWSVTIAQ